MKLDNTEAATVRDAAWAIVQALRSEDRDLHGVQLSEGQHRELVAAFAHETLGRDGMYAVYGAGGGRIAKNLGHLALAIRKANPPFGTEIKLLDRGKKLAAILITKDSKNQRPAR